MRIAIFSESFAPVVNGVSVSVDCLGTALEALGHELAFFAPRFPGYTDARPRVFRFPSVITPYQRNYPLALPAGPGLFRAFRDFHPDVVHTQTPFMTGVAGMLWARRTRTPIVSTNHTLYAEYVHYIRGMPRPLMRGITKAWMRFYYNRCDAVVVPSRATGGVLERYGVRTPWRAVPTGIEMPGGPDSSQDARERLGVPSGAPLMVFVGRLAKEKNLDLLLEAFGRVLTARPDARLAVIGDGPYRTHCEAQAVQLGIREAVVFTGALPRSELPALLCSADLFLFPSLTETQGLAIGEAASCGLPSVVVNAGGAPEFVRDGETGYLVSNDAREFAARALELLNDSGMRSSFSRQAKEFAATLTMETMARKMLEVYRMAGAGN